MYIKVTKVLYKVEVIYYSVYVSYKTTQNNTKKWRIKKMKSQEEIRKRQQEYKDKMFNKFSNEFTRKIILQKQNQMLREELEKLKAMD